MLREIDDAVPEVLPRRLGPVLRRFSHADEADTVLKHSDGVQVITGFGPTNAPTAGTLSAMLGVVELQRQLDVPVTVVISELGAWNSRNVAWVQLEAVRDQMLGFMRAIGFDETRGTLRSHLDPGNLTRAGRIARFLSRQDFLDHHESLLQLYDDRGLLGTEVGVMVDALYTVADVLGPFEEADRRVLMVSGLEEAYFTELARLVLHRQASVGELSLGWEGEIGALYFRVLQGLSGYPKMSKSIPESSIHLGMPEADLQARILTDHEGTHEAILAAIELSSGWTQERLNLAREAHCHRAEDPSGWLATKRDYLATFLSFADQWRACGP